MRASRRWIGALLRLYPREHRAHAGTDLADAMEACVERERARGTSTPRIACLLIADAVQASFLVRRDARRRARRVLSRPSGDSVMQSILYDVRYAARAIRRAPFFSTIIIATLTLAIGANTAIFSIVDAVLLRSLPYPQPDRLVVLYEDVGAPFPFGFSPPDFVAFRERARSYDGIAAFRSVEYELSGIDQPVRVSAARVSATLFDVIGVAPALGRPFTSEEDTGRQPVAILSNGLWRRSFGGDPAVIGRAVTLDRRAYTIVGVMPPQFVFPSRGPAMNNVPADVYLPISFSDVELRAFGSMYNNSVIGRLKPGVATAQAAAEASAVVKQVFSELYPAQLRVPGWNLTATVTPLRDDVVGNVQRILFVLLAAVGVVLLIACADIACLMLTRAAAREREMAIRSALGADRWRVLRLVLIEAGLLSIAGGLCGLALARWGAQALVSAAPMAIPRSTEVGIEWRVLAFTLVASTVAALCCGVLPAWEASRRESSVTLKEGGRASSLSVRQRRIFATLVTAQFACAVVLLTCGGLLIRSLVRLVGTDPGVTPNKVISIALNLPSAGYPTGADVRAFYDRLLERVGRLPGVASAGAATDLPLSVRERRVFTIEMPPASTASLPHGIANDWVVGRYFDVVGVRTVRGRALSEQDTPTSEPSVVLNETMARRYWPGEDPVGRRIAWGMPNNHGPWMRIVGIIGDVKQAGLAAPTEPQTWQPWTQLPDPVIGGNVPGLYRGLRVMVRGEVPPESLLPAIRGEVRALDPALPIADVQTLDEIVRASSGPQRFNALLLGGFAGVALLLAAVGIGGVLAISVSRRTQEIGIRLALGAPAIDMVRMVVRQGMTLVVAGLMIGIPAAWAAAQLLRSLLFETAPHDALAFAGATLVLCGVALTACTIPALRASRVDPMRALRIE